MPRNSKLSIALILNAAPLAASFTTNHALLAPNHAAVAFVPKKPFVRNPSPIHSERLMEQQLEVDVVQQSSYEPFRNPLPIDVDPHCGTTIAVSAHPPIHWTVPGMNLGYRDESTGQWYDKDGPREGPPLNYWRQSMDERGYKNDMDVVDAALCLLDDDVDLDAVVEKAEKSSGIRYPWLSRKLLGTWAPVLHAGEKVVTVNNGSPCGCCEGTIDCSVIIDIQRASGPKLGPRNHYGVFYANMEEGEEVRIVSGDGAVDSRVGATKENRSVVIGNERAGKLAAPICLGRITYLSDYILVQRRQDGSMDIWLRLDEAYLGKL
mmetsp:Transcript_34499/g.83493  ORF Transcript_34499/g.83493 Transcript_34499/m.83493 type:complete len:321 (-) Transcript_34499:142-1104(-)|eukprot:CAMPEP_0181109706 /NCGR_PEP_ID=MMETSP1071-20121207/18320_1 /TAXON_ID=35127 /ORGANISM="Thalassiosira sp., Strain NH16" /LENGTH=320 /DNA_ID=CAMNT_0023193421 /DNA_START=148 /DNA_END=1110 /DNA_ORIENTATION=+